jgi:hypothetical protein
MTLPEHALPKRRRQILDDETGEAHRFNASEHPDTSIPEGTLHRDALHEDALHRNTLHRDTRHQDNWARSFVDRLAGLVRKIGGNNPS